MDPAPGFVVVVGSRNGRSKPSLKMAAAKPQNIGVLKLSVQVFISSSF